MNVSRKVMLVEKNYTRSRGRLRQQQRDSRYAHIAAARQ
jgi:hypothetical protein